MSRVAVPGSRRPLFILVTGAAGGIGRATTSRLADVGHVVFAADRREDALRAIANEHHTVHPIALDITDHSAIGDVIEQVRKATDGYGLDVLVNVAGKLVLGPVEAVPDGSVREQFDVNVFGLLDVTRAFLPEMRARRAGRIVNVSSILGRFALPGSGVYSASKFALEALSDAMRVEIAPFGVRVVLVEPGVIDTPLYDMAAASLVSYDGALEPYRATWPAGFDFPERLLKAAASADSAGAIVAKAALVSKPRARYRPGFRNRLNTWLLTTLPTRAADRIKTRIAGIASASEPEKPAVGGRGVSSVTSGSPKGRSARE